MKRLKIGLGLIGLLLLVFQLPASGYNSYENESPQIEPKTPQGDTIRMTKRVSKEDFILSFSFRGEEGASYKVIWGDGKERIVTVKGNPISLNYWYDQKEATYDVLLFGIPSEEE